MGLFSWHRQCIVNFTIEILTIIEKEDITFYLSRDFEQQHIVSPRTFLFFTMQTHFHLPWIRPITKDVQLKMVLVCAVAR